MRNTLARTENPLSTSDLVTLTSAAAGAFLGAFLAFVLEAYRRWATERDARYSMLRLAQFSLSMQLRSLVIIRNQYLNELRDDPQRFMSLVPFVGDVADPQVDLSSLGFLGAKDAIEVLQRVHMAQSAWSTAMTALQERNRMMVLLYEKVEPRGPIEFESGVQKVSIEAGFARRLKGITDGLYESVDSAIELQHSAVEGLAEAGKRMFRRREFWAVTELDD